MQYTHTLNLLISKQPLIPGEIISLKLRKEKKERGGEEKIDSMEFSGIINLFRKKGQKHTFVSITQSK